MLVNCHPKKKKNLIIQKFCLCVLTIKSSDFTLSVVRYLSYVELIQRFLSYCYIFFLSTIPHVSLLKEES